MPRDWNFVRRLVVGTPRVIFPICVLASAVSAASASVDPVCAVNHEPGVCRAAPANTYMSTGAPSLVDPLGRGVWVIDEENDEVALMLPTGSSRRVAVGRWPQQLVATADGRVFVSCRQDGRVDVIAPDFRVTQVQVGDEPRALALDELSGRLYVGLVTAKGVLAIDTKTFQPIARTDVPDMPTSIALTSAGLAVASQKSTSVRFYDALLKKETRRIDLPRDRTSHLSPRLLVAAGDGLLLFAERARTGLDQPVSFGGYGGEQTDPIDTLLFSMNALSKGYAPAVVLTAVKASEPVAAVFSRSVLHVASRGRGTIVSIGVTPELNVVGSTFELRPRLGASVADAFEREPALAKYLSGDQLALAQQADLTGLTQTPEGRLVATDALGRRVFHVALGRDVLASLVFRPIRRTSLLGLLGGQGAFNNVFGATGLGGLSTSPGLGFGGGGFGRGGWRGPTSFVAFAPEVPVTPVLVQALGPGRDVELRVGQHLFHASTDFRISSHGVACASCHPDGREDGRVWSLKGTRRQTPMLAHRLVETAPFNWLGTSATLKQNLTETMTVRLEGEGLRGRELNALTRFIRDGLRPVGLPAPKEPELVAQGKDLFNDPVVGCSTCHPADFSTTDGERHDVGTLSAVERGEFRQAHPAPVFRVRKERLGFERPVQQLTPGQIAQLVDRFGRAGRVAAIPPPTAPRKFDTPSLKALAVTAPYFHDGAASSLEELIAKNGDRMGMTSQLDETQRRALVAYLQTL